MRLTISAFLCFIFLVSSISATPKDSPHVMSWPDTQVDIASHVTDTFNFFRSISLFRGAQYLIDENRYLKIDGDSFESISGYEVVHILGDLNSSVYIEDQAELVIRKNFAKDAIVYASGIQKIYVGGDFLGKIESTGTVELIVKGNFKGTVSTGHPSTVILVEQSFDGVVKPTVPEDGGLVNVHIKGNTLLEYIEPICRNDYSDVKITVGIIDADKGIYTCGTRHRLVVESSR